MFAFLSLVLVLSVVSALPANQNSHGSLTSRLDKIKNMYAFEGFVYTLTKCPSKEKLLSDFIAMVAKGARNVITFEYCGDGTDPDYYGEVIQAAGLAGLNIIPLAWTLLIGNQTLQDTAIPKIEAVTKAVIDNPGPVLAVALGDEPLYDWDFGTPQNLADHILQMKEDFQAAGLSDIPVSISDMAYGWQIEGDISSVADAVDFFMINNFPYFAWDAQSGGSNTSWADFTNDMAYFAELSQGKPLLVTQTGWPSNEDQYAPNSPEVVASVASEKGYWQLLDDHCEDFFKPQNIGWMWRSWDDNIEGWGVMSGNREKWDFIARLSC